MWFVTAFPNTLVCAYRVSDFRAEAEMSHRATFQITGRAQGMPGLHALDHHRAIRRWRDVWIPSKRTTPILAQKTNISDKGVLL